VQTTATYLGSSPDLVFDANRQEWRTLADVQREAQEAFCAYWAKRNAAKQEANS